LFACSSGGGEGKRGVAGGEVAQAGELPVRDDKGGVVIELFAGVVGGLLLAVGASFAADRAQGGGIAAAFRREVSATPRRR
jgi:hypothetical protein